MVENSEIEAKIEELNSIENQLSQKLDQIRKAKQSLHLIKIVEQKELTGYEDEKETIPTYKINLIKNIDPQTMAEITDKRIDEIWTSINGKLPNITR